MRSSHCSEFVSHKTGRVTPKQLINPEPASPTVDNVGAIVRIADMLDFPHVVRK